MDDEEWQLLLNDCQLATPSFSDERLMQVFEEEANPNPYPNPNPNPNPNLAQVFEEEVELRGHSLDAAEWLALMVRARGLSAARTPLFTTPPSPYSAGYHPLVRCAWPSCVLHPSTSGATSTHPRCPRCPARSSECSRMRSSPAPRWTCR